MRRFFAVVSLCVCILLVAGCGGDGDSSSNSTEVSNWQLLKPLPSGKNFLAATYGGGKYVVVGESGTVMISADAVSWTWTQLGLTDPWTDWVRAGSIYSVIYGGGMLRCPVNSRHSHLKRPLTVC